MRDNWLKAIKGGSPNDGIGQYDLLVTLAVKLQWTPAQIAEMDPHYLDELMAYFSAESQHAVDERKRQEREAKLAKLKAKRR